MKKLSLQNTIIFIMICATTVSLIVSATLIRTYVVTQEYGHTKEKIKTIAELVATNKEVEAALNQTHTSNNAIQHLSLRTAETSQVDFIVVLDQSLTRLSHPDKHQIGKPFSNLPDAEKALLGNAHYSTETGILGEGIRYFSPVKNSDGTITGVVCVGLTLETIHKQVVTAQYNILIGLLLGLLVGILGAIFLAKKIKHILFGLEPREIAAKLEEIEIIENEISEGLLAIDQHQKIIMINREAYQLINQLSLKSSIKIDHYLTTHLFETIFADCFQTHTKIKDQTLHINDLEIIANISPIYINGVFSGAVATFRDQSKMQQLIHRLSGTEQYIDSLRAQTHEFMNKMHVIMGLIELKKYDDVSEYIQLLTVHYSKEVGYITDSIKTPAIAGFILGKISEADEQDVTITLSDSSSLPNLKLESSIHLLLQVLGNLLDNAIEAVACQPIKQVDVLLTYDIEANIVIIQITDTGNGIPTFIRQHIFEQGISTKGKQRGFGLNLVDKTIKQHKGFIDISSTSTGGTQFYVEFPLRNGG